MKRQIAIGVVAAAAVALGAVGLAGPIAGATTAAPALAQAPGGPQQGPPGGQRQGPREGAPGGQRQGPRDGAPGGERQGAPGALGAGLRATMQAVASSLGMTPEDLRQALRGGQSLADVAAAHGVDQATLVQTITSAARTQLDQAVTDGRLTRGQADALLNVVQQFAPQMITRTGPAGGRLGFAPGQGPRERQGGERGAMLQPVANLLGMTPQEIAQARRQGQSLAQIAAAKGVDQNTLVQTITGALKSRLDAAVAAGRLSQERADALYQRAQQQVPQMVTRTGTPSVQRGPRGPRPDGSQRGPRGGAPPAGVPVQ
ncbi:MAG TPA: hypothetical protein VFE37_04430 [Chloroflexota bacterium]|nr:hypothetical protein [Chloroflexota bacterium]